ncbi:MAG: DUF1990 family protein [Actinomycetales bacterium]
MRIARPGSLERLLPRYELLATTYAEVSATRRRPLPAGYRHLDHITELGAGRATFERAAGALMTWQMHRRAGLVVVADGQPAEGQTVVAGFGRPVCVVIPCRVVYVVHEDRRRGFGYGTLPGHPERGEESFVVRHDADDHVRLHITAFSQPGSWLNRLVQPIDRWFQTRATRRYEDALRRLSA